jgi:ABC-2 type transport system permease protein
MSTDNRQLQASYFRVLMVFFRNALVRELSFRSNFMITLLSRLFWFAAQIVMFDLIFRVVPQINEWTRAEYFGFMATGMLINAIVEAVFMPNCANFSEMIRTGSLDFALLKPIDTQFLVSFEKMDLSMANQIVFAVGLLVYALYQNGVWPSGWVLVIYPALLVSAVAFFYSLMLALASSSIWLGRNQGLLDFWFYVTVFARYPASIYSGSPTGELIRFTFQFVLPILLVVTVPAQVVMSMISAPSLWTGATLVAAGLSLLISRAIFQFALTQYRSASS